jgi:hypothetical protein
MKRRLSRRRALVLAGSGLAALAGCLGGGGDGSGNGDGTANGGDNGNGNGNGNGNDNGDGDGVGNGDGDGSSNNVDVPMPLTEHEVPLEFELEKFAQNAVNGGPGKDGIPSIDDPQFDGVEGGNEMLDPGDPVFGVEIDGDARAYPQRILVLHEIVNDSFGDRNVAVTYCPLTGTALGFERGDVEFGVSGNLVNNNLIMYDRETDSRWPQILGTGVDGQLTGKSLQEFRLVWTTWEQWREKHPDTQVLNQQTGFARNYGRDPYGSYNPRGGYYDNGRLLFENLNSDDRFSPKKVFMGARSADGAVAFDKTLLREDGLLDAEVGGVPYLAAYDSTLDTAYAYRNPDGVSIDRTSAGYESPEGTHDAAELPLEPVHTFDAMWFAWAGFYPNTVVVA